MKYTGLAINGKRFGGKSMAAKHLVKLYPRVFGTIISLAAPLKADWEHQTGLKVPINPVAKDEWRKAIFVFSDRAVEQEPGKYTKIFKRSFYTARLASDHLVVCDDLRRQTPERPELETALELGMCLMRIECPAQVRREKFGMKSNHAVDAHQTEVGLDNHPFWKEHPDCVIQNNGDEKFMADVLDFVWSKFESQLTQAGYVRE